jgi:5'-3' exonuclease
VASGDRDLFQLVDDDRGVRVLYCGKGVAKLEVLDDAAIRARYGVPAGSYADFAALRGDPSDGLPGVPGVGEKTASSLVARYGSLAAMVEALDDPAAGFAPGLRTKLIAAADYLKVAPTVVRVARDIALPPLDTALPGAPKEPRLIELAQSGAWPGRATPGGLCLAALRPSKNAPDLQERGLTSGRTRG